jgi:hypothetical protein
MRLVYVQLVLLDRFEDGQHGPHWILPHVENLERHTSLPESEAPAFEDSFAATAFSLPLLFL